MSTDEFKGKKLLIVGMARSGIAAAKLAVKAGALVTVNDQKEESAFNGQLDELKELPLTWKLGQKAEELLEDTDILLISPAVPVLSPVVVKAKEKNIPVVGELEFAARLNTCPMAAVTGTNGKTTTVTLLGAIFQEMGKVPHLAGNIGYPLSAAVLESNPEDQMVVEVSSFQLETTEKFHPAAAAVLNVTEDHMNRHGTMAVYTDLKRHIFDAQNENDVAVLNYDDPSTREMAKTVSSQVAFFSRKEEMKSGAFVRDGKLVIRWQDKEEIVCRTDEIKIPGPHNLENAMAASLIAYTQGVPAPVIRQALRTFEGVEHRLEFTRELDGVRYINDSKATNVDSTFKAIESMRLPTVLLLGGYDKHVSFTGLADKVKNSSLIRHCILMGATRDQIDEALKGAGYENIEYASDMQDAVEKARKLASEGWNVLLSPACASFDMFSCFEERGMVFKKIVNELK